MFISLPLTISCAISNSTIHEPSFNSDSPSIKECSFLGAPTSLNNANTATVSVQLRIEPNMKAPDHEQYVLSQQPNTIFSENSRKIDETSTHGNARIRICPDCFLKQCQSALKPDSNTKIGRKIISSPCGSMFWMRETDSPTNPSSEANFPTKIPIINNMGVQGTPVFLFTSRTSPATARPMKRKKTTKDVCGI